MSDADIQALSDIGGSSAEDPPAPITDARPVPRITIQAFCESPELVDVIDAAAADRRMARAQVKVHGGGVAAAAEFYREAATPNLIVVEAKLAMPQLEAELDRLADVTDPGTRVVVIGSINDVELYRGLIQRGVSEYLVAPVDVAGIIRTISGLFVEQQDAPIGRTIAFVGAKGGVGSSTIAHNVAWSIARGFESEVVVVDLDLAFGTAGLDYNKDPTQGIAEAVNAPERLDDNFFDRLLARCTDNLSLLAAPATLDNAYDFGEFAFEPVIEIAQTGVPTVILDVPHMWTSWVRKTLFGADEVVVTAEPDLANLRNAKNLVDLMRQERRNDAPPRLVVNKVGLAKRPEIGVNDLSQALGLEPIATFPFDGQLFGTASNNGQMIAELEPKNPNADTFDRMAASVLGRAEAKGARRSLLAPLLEQLRGKKAG